MPGPSRNYAKELEQLIQKLQQEGKVPRLLLHACCAPCSSAVLEYLSQYFAITLLYYNPNIAPLEEYQKREAELRRLVSQMKFTHPVEVLPCQYDGQAFVQAARGLEGEPEGGKRCEACFRLRLHYAAQEAARLRMDHPEDTLSQLAERCDPPVTKSALNHRLRKLVELGQTHEEGKAGRT